MTVIVHANLQIVHATKHVPENAPIVLVIAVIVRATLLARANVIATVLVNPQIVLVM